MTYTVVVLARARQDVQQIYDWIAECSAEGAERWFASFEEATTTLRANPFDSPLAPEDEFVAYEIRKSSSGHDGAVPIVPSLRWSATRSASSGSEDRDSLP